MLRLTNLKDKHDFHPSHTYGISIFTSISILTITLQLVVVHHHSSTYIRQNYCFHVDYWSQQIPRIRQQLRQQILLRIDEKTIQSHV